VGAQEPTLDDSQVVLVLTAGVAISGHANVASNQGFLEARVEALLGKLPPADAYPLKVAKLSEGQFARCRSLLLGRL